MMLLKAYAQYAVNFSRKKVNLRSPYLCLTLSKMWNKYKPIKYEIVRLAGSSLCTCDVDGDVVYRMGVWSGRDEVLKVGELTDTGTDTVSRSALNWWNSRARYKDMIRGYPLGVTFILSQRRNIQAYTNTHLLFLWTVMVMVALGYGSSQGGCLGLQVAEAQRQREGEGEGIGDWEGSGEQEEENEEEAGDEWRWLNGQEVLCALREEAHLWQIGEGDVAVLIQDGGQVRQVQGEGEECAATALALL